MEAEKTDQIKRDCASYLLRIGLPSLAFLLAALGNPAFRVHAAEITVTIDFPSDGSSFAKPAPRAIIAGRAQVSGTLAPLLDLAIVIDRSGSTANPSGADIDGDKTVGELRRLLFPFKLQDLLQPRINDPDDTVLAAELAGARNLLKVLDPANTRVCVVSFGRDQFSHWPRDVQGPDARVENPLTTDYEEVRQALSVIGARGSQGGTNIAAAIREATAELIGANGDGPARPGARKVMLLLTDGFPSFPAGSPNVMDPEDINLALRAASLAQRADIEIHTYALGPRAVFAPFALTEIARITGGHFNPISDPSQVVYRLKEFIFAQLKSLTVENATLNQPAEQLALGPEGAYIAVVPVKAGVNKIEVTGIVNDGTRGGAAVLLNYLSEEERDSALELTGRELALSPGARSFDDLKLELEKEKERWLELDRKMKELEFKAKDKAKSQEQLELDLEMK